MDEKTVFLTRYIRTLKGKYDRIVNDLVTAETTLEIIKEKALQLEKENVKLKEEINRRDINKKVYSVNPDVEVTETDLSNNE